MEPFFRRCIGIHSNQLVIGKPFVELCQLRPHVTLPFLMRIRDMQPHKFLNTQVVTFPCVEKIWRDGHIFRLNPVHDARIVYEHGFQLEGFLGQMFEQSEQIIRLRAMHQNMAEAFKKRCETLAAA